MRQVLNKLPRVEHPDLLVGVNTVDDAGVFRLSDDLALVQTVDFFTPIVDDPYTYGAIAVANSLSDVYAMGGEPVTALNIVCYPKSLVGPEMLTEILRGGHDKATEAGCLIVGGHSVEDTEMKYGLAVTGKINPAKILTNAGVKPGDALVLTKPLGTGIISTAFKLGTISDETYRAATETMLTLNKTASELAVKFGANACTDITGFGLFGHAWGMARASQSELVFKAEAIPLLPDALRYANEGFLTKGDRTNREYVGEGIRYIGEIAEDLLRVCFDPQTSGGLLISLPAENSDALVAQLRNAGLLFAQTIGTVGNKKSERITVMGG